MFTYVCIYKLTYVFIYLCKKKYINTGGLLWLCDMFFCHCWLVLRHKALKKTINKVSLCIPGWHASAAGIKGLCHHSWPKYKAFCLLLSHLIFSWLLYCFVEEVAGFLLRDPAPVLSVLIPVQLEKDLVIWEWWLTPIILALRKWKAEGGCIFQGQPGPTWWVSELWTSRAP